MKKKSTPTFDDLFHEDGMAKHRLPNGVPAVKLLRVMRAHLESRMRTLPTISMRHPGRLESVRKYGKTQPPQMLVGAIDALVDGLAIGALSDEEVLAVLEAFPLFDIYGHGYWCDYHSFHKASRAHFVDCLLFLLELRTPGCDLLRNNRVRIDESWIVGGNDNKVPEPEVATRAWEAKLRDDKAFAAIGEKIRKYIAREVPAPPEYWMLSRTARCERLPSVFLAFDADMRFDVEASNRVCGVLDGEIATVRGKVSPKLRKLSVQQSAQVDATSNRKKSRRDVSELTDEHPLNILEDFCDFFHLEMVGTFVADRKHRMPLGILAQHPRVDVRANVVRACFPAFYTCSQITELEDTDFFILHKALKGTEHSRRFDFVNKRRPRASPLPVGALADALRVAASVLKGRLKYHPRHAWDALHLLSEPWWDTETLDRLIRVPTRSPPEEAPRPKPTNAKQIALVISETLRHSPLPPAQMKAWFDLAKHYEQRLQPSRSKA